MNIFELAEQRFGRPAAIIPVLNDMEALDIPVPAEIPLETTLAADPAAVVVGPSPEDLETERKRLWNIAASECADVWGEGTLDFIRTHVPSLVQEITRAHDRLNATWFGPVTDFEAALASWKAINLQAAQLSQPERNFT